jgi:hypothetical protein
VPVELLKCQASKCGTVYYQFELDRAWSDCTVAQAGLVFRRCNPGVGGKGFFPVPAGLRKKIIGLFNSMFQYI